MILKKKNQFQVKFEGRGFVLPGGQNEENPGWEKKLKIIFKKLFFSGRERL